MDACPGSGKTRTLVGKLLRCLSQIGDTTRRVACITYTNAAVHEIEHRLRMYASEESERLVDVATIHSFCLSNILSPFHWMLPGYQNGLAVAAPDSNLFRALSAEVADAYLLDPASAREALEGATRAPDGAALIVPPTPPEAALEFWERLEAEGYVDFPNIVYQSYRLLVEHPSLLRGLQARFAWLLVDEFQDTSRLQVEILNLIAAGGRTRFFLVGDVRQSIFGFAGAEPALMAQFGETIAASAGPVLRDNYRSSAHIIAHAERLLPAAVAMNAVGPCAEYGFEPKYLNVETPFIAITEHFLPALAHHGIPLGEAAILAPQWFGLYRLAGQLREFGVPVIGPGARPYRRSHFYASLAEQLCAQAERPAPDRIRQIERELFFLLNNLTGQTSPTLFAFAGRLLVQRLIRISQETREEHQGAVSWLEASVHQVADVLCDGGWVRKAEAERLCESVADMRRDMERNNVDLANLQVADLGMFADPDSSVKLLTLHRSKGREFDAVAMVDLHDGFIPHWTAKTPEAVAEGRRLFYVGLTRARKLLFYFTTAENWRPVSRFLAELGLTA